MIVTAAERAKPSDGEITSRLVGTWATCIAGGTSTDPDGSIQYHEDGTFTAEGKIQLGDNATATVKVEGTWKVTSGVIVHGVTKTSHPGIAPLGAEMKEAILAIDDKAMTFKRGVGHKRERKRIQE